MRPKKIIVCVHSSVQTLSVRKFVLETHGYRVLAAAGSEQALEMMERFPDGQLHLLITDLLLPGMDGNELVRRAKQLHPSMPALIMSHTVAAHDCALAADAFLPKGACSTAEVLQSVRRLVARKRGPKSVALLEIQARAHAAYAARHAERDAA